MVTTRRTRDHSPESVQLEAVPRVGGLAVRRPGLAVGANAERGGQSGGWWVGGLATDPLSRWLYREIQKVALSLYASGSRSVGSGESGTPTRQPTNPSADLRKQGWRLPPTHRYVRQPPNVGANPSAASRRRSLGAAAPLPVLGADAPALRLGLPPNHPLGLALLPLDLGGPFVSARPYARIPGCPVAADVIPQPAPHPPLGEHPGDELFELHQLDRVVDGHGFGSALGIVEAGRLGLLDRRPQVGAA